MPASNGTKKIRSDVQMQESEKKLIGKKKLISRPPDGGYGWIVVFASFLCNIIVDGTIFSFGIFLQEIANELQVSKSATAWVGSLQTGFYLIVGPFVSFLANKYDCRLVGIIGGVLSSVAFLLSYKAENIITLCLTYGLLGGIGYGFIYLPAIVIVGFYFEEKRAFATGIAVCGSGIGGFVLAPLTRLSVSKYGWRLTVAFLAGVNLLCAFFALFFKPLKEEFEMVDDAEPQDLKNNLNHSTNYEQPIFVDNTTYVTQITDELNNNQNGKAIEHDKPRTDTINSTGKDYRNRTDSVRSQTSMKRPRNLSTSTIHYAAASLIEYENSSKRASFRIVNESDPNNNASLPSEKLQSDAKKSKPMFDLTLLASPTFLLFSFSGFLTLSGFFIPFMYIVDWVTLLGLNANQGAMILSAIGITNTFGRVLCGWCSDRPEISAFWINNVALIVGGTFTIILPNYFHTYPLLILYGIVFGMSIACFAALRSIMTAELFGMERLTDAFGLLLLIQGIATMIGGPIAGWFYDITKSYNASFYAAGSVILASGLLCIPLPMVLKWEQAKLNKKSSKV